MFFKILKSHTLFLAHFKRLKIKKSGFIISFTCQRKRDRPLMEIVPQNDKTTKNKTLKSNRELLSPKNIEKNVKELSDCLNLLNTEDDEEIAT
jgi:hypothetical protein